MSHRKLKLESHKMATRGIVANERKKVKRYSKFFRFCDEVETIFDIGSNVGVFALQCFLHNPSAMIYAFEPVKENFEYLERNIEANHAFKRVSSINLGLWSSEVEMFLGIPKDWKDTEFTGMYSVFGIKNEVKANFITLDSYCAMAGLLPDYIKLDVEGSEKEILLGGKECLKKVKYLSYEANRDYADKNEGIKNLLDEAGLTEIPKMKFKDDLFFVRDKKCIT